MKHLWSSLKLSIGTLALVGLSAPVLAQDAGCPGCERTPSDWTQLIDDEQDDDALLKEVEGMLNDMLLVDETGAIVFREEVKSMSPRRR